MKYVLILIMLLPSFLSGQERETADTLLHIQTVTVSSVRPADIIPSQTLSGTELSRLNSQNVADALRYFSGVQIKDYGGVGGIKTVNVRSMGTNHTGVVYDGVALGNAQNGQIDLGQFSLDNMMAISLYNGQRSNILQPAKDFGSAASIYMRTRTPYFDDHKRWNGRVAMRTGSFDLVNPSLLFEYKLSERVSAQLSGEWVNSSGKYKFRYRRLTPQGTTAYDTTAVRQNGDINATRVELNLFGSLTGGSWQAKAYNYYSKRGIPGAIVNNVWYRGERQWDNNSMVQGQLTYSKGNWTTLNHAKYAYYHTHYINNDERQIKVDNQFDQQELYFSSAHQWELRPQWQVSASYDLQWNTMTADIPRFARPDRISNLIAVATALNLDRFKAQASLLGTFISDRRADFNYTKGRHVLTPSVFMNWQPARNYKYFTIRAFYKKSFRMPTFNDLYYTDRGNAALSPEVVSQYNIGLNWIYAPLGGMLRNITISADTYYNYIKDKIVAYPKGQQFRWTMLNLGRVDIKGIDLNANATLSPARELDITLRAQYTYQHAIDITDRRDSYYRDQIPYIPHHSGSAVANLSWRQWGLNYSWIYVGERYNQPENIPANYMPAWYTHDLSLSRDITLRHVSLRVLLEVNNLLSQDYSVILNYPMPRRNFRISVTCNF